jgi:hypothetical protein
MYYVMSAVREVTIHLHIVPKVRMCYECRVLSGRDLCDELLTRPGESYRLWCVVVCVIYKPHE